MDVQVENGSARGPYADEAQQEERRTQVLALHLRRLPQRQIAIALQIDQSTVSRDLVWITKHWREKYGTPASIEPTEEIGEAIGLFAEMEAQAIRDMSKLKIENAKQRNAYMRTILIARQMRINLLQDLGFIDRRGADINITLRADTVRQALRDEGLLVLAGRPQAVLEDGADNEDEIDKWLRRVE